MNCHNRKLEIQFIMQILWGIVSLCVCVSLLEIMYFCCTNTTWVEFLYEDEEMLSDDYPLNEIQEEAIGQKSKYKCFYSVCHEKVILLLVNEQICLSIYFFHHQIKHTKMFPHKDTRKSLGSPPLYSLLPLRTKTTKF